uniref:Uncharacterized protein n=1 Tax=Globodera rostochiensis TaxID=31243 RepID=A0A914IHE5_GLORO
MNEFTSIPFSDLPERVLRFAMKLFQLLTSLFLVVSLYNIGPHWVLLLASLAVPLFGLYVLFGSQERILRHHPLPYVRYKSQSRARSWLRIDVTISATMAVICVAFAVVLFIGYFQEHSANGSLLQAAISALLLFLLYSLNALLCVRQLKMGQVDFLAEKEKHNSVVSTTRSSSKSPLNALLSPQSVPEAWQHSLEKAFPQIITPTKMPCSDGSQVWSEEFPSEFEKGDGSERWRQIPVRIKDWEGKRDVRRKTSRRIRVEKRGNTEFGMDMGMWRTLEEQRIGGDGKIRRKRQLDSGEVLAGVENDRHGRINEKKKMTKLSRFDMPRRADAPQEAGHPGSAEDEKRGTESKGIGMALKREDPMERKFDVPIRSKWNPVMISTDSVSISAEERKRTEKMRHEQVTEL